MSSKYFIVGANGQLGRALREQYPDAQFADIEELDISNQESVANFDWSNVDVILNAAAYTNVDSAETADGRVSAWGVNAKAVSYLVKACIEHDMALVHISSDYVFDGTTNPHLEDEPFSPLSSYGASKAAGDLMVTMLPRHYILRTTWVIGEGNNFVRTMLGLAKKGVSPTVVSDQIGRLTFSSELVRAIDHLLTVQAEFGTYNVTNSGVPMSWADITRQIFNMAGYQELTVTDITTNEYYLDKINIAPRPLQSTMSLEKLQDTSFESEDWQKNLQHYIDKQHTV